MKRNLADRLALTVFEGIHERPPWLTLVRILRRHYSCTLASLVLRHSTDVRWNGYATSDAEWDLGEWNQRYLPSWVESHPYPVESLEPGRCYSSEDIVDYDTWKKSKFFKDVIAATGTERFVCLCIAEPGGYKGWLYLSRREALGPFSPDERAEVSALIPNLQSALHAFASLMRLKIERDLYQDSLARMGIGTIILDNLNEVQSVDHVADNIIRQNPAFRTLGSKLKFATAELDTEFDMLCREVSGKNGSARAMKIPRDGQTDIHILIRSAKVSHDYGANVRPAVQIFINDPDSGHKSLPDRVLSDLFDLTRTEAMVASLIGKGHSIHEAAEMLKVTEGTIRSHIKRIFSKMGVSRQAELVHLLNANPTLLH